MGVFLFLFYGGGRGGLAYSLLLGSLRVSGSLWLLVWVLVGVRGVCIIGILWIALYMSFGTLILDCLLCGDVM